jgi:hypothetical protein
MQAQLPAGFADIECHLKYFFCVQLQWQTIIRKHVSHDAD